MIKGSLPEIKRGIRTIQEFDAIRVGSPKREERISSNVSDGMELARREMERDRQMDLERQREMDLQRQREIDRLERQREQDSAKLDMIAQQQERLLHHTGQVAQQQGALSHRLASTEDAMAKGMIQQAMQNKDSMIHHLNQLQNNQIEDYTRELLQQHIHYITAIVKRLNCDIEAIEDDLRGRDVAVVGTNKAVNKLEVHHVTMLQDMRSRIARGDTGLKKHSSDIAYIMDELRRLEGQQVALKENLTGQIHRLEAEIISITGELERQTGEQASELTHLKSDSSHRIALLDGKNKALLDDVRDQLHSYKALSDADRDKLEYKFQAMIDKATDAWNKLMSRVDQQMGRHADNIEIRLGNLEAAAAVERERLNELHQGVEERIFVRIDDNLNYFKSELDAAKQEFRKGFNEVQDSIRNTKAVVEGKRKLLADQLRKEMSRIRKALLIELPMLQQDGEKILVYP